MAAQNDLQKKLEALQAEKDSLVNERDQLKAQQRRLQSEASKSLAGVAVNRLLGQARSQAERRVESESLQAAVDELNRRIESTAAQIAETHEEIDWQREAALRQEIQEIVESIAPLADEALRGAMRAKGIADEYLRFAIGLYDRKGKRASGVARAAHMNRVVKHLREFGAGFKGIHERNPL